MNDTKWETYSEELEDEDLIMEEDEDDDEVEEEEERNNAVYPEDYSKTSSSNSSSNVTSPRFVMSSYNDFSRHDMGAAASPLHGWNDAMDEKGESVALLMHLEKTIVHQDFFNDFSDDFDQEDLA